MLKANWQHNFTLGHFSARENYIGSCLLEFDRCSCSQPRALRQTHAKRYCQSLWRWFKHWEHCWCIQSWVKLWLCFWRQHMRCSEDCTWSATYSTLSNLAWKVRIEVTESEWTEGILWNLDFKQMHDWPRLIRCLWQQLVKWAGKLVTFNT